jgi:NADH dehydrogenase/NADH:ubiquinone oxidoreductase subunit G
MTNLEIEETSGVDHPAHLHEGWLVVKASNASTVADVLRTLPEPMEESMSEATDLIVESEPVLNAEGEETKMEGDMEAKAVEEELAMAMARITELEARLAELEGMAEAETEMEMPVEDAVVAMAKAAPAPLRKAMEELAKAAADAKAELAKEREDRADSEAITKAAETFKHLNLDPALVGPALRRLSATDEALAKSIEDALLSADAQNESANIFSEVGKGFVPSGDAFEKMTSLAKAAVSEGKAATVEQAMAHVAVSNPALYNDYLTEKGA